MVPLPFWQSPAGEFHQGKTRIDTHGLFLLVDA